MVTGIERYVGLLIGPAKRCSRCKVVQTLTNFYASTKSSDSKASWCKTCTLAIERDRSNRVRRNTPEQKRKWQLMTRYRLTPDCVEAMKLSQGNKCPLCEREFFEGLRTHVDHCHNTGEVRGVLCHICNICLGGWDDLGWRKRALAYLGIAA